MRIAVAVLLVVFFASQSFGSVRRIEISKKSPAKAPIKFSLTITPDRRQSGHVFVKLVLPPDQEKLVDLWKTYLWLQKEGKVVLAIPLEMTRADDKSITIRYYGHVDMVGRGLLAIRCGKHAPLVETIYQIDVSSYLENDQVDGKVTK
jgi:hypothetical protein